MTTLVELVARTAADHPGRPAVSDRRGTLTYAELDRDAGRLAGVLSAAGVRAGHRVVVHRDRTRHLLTHLLAVLRCGAAVVPVDVRYPVERRRLMAELSDPALVLTVPAHAADPVAPAGVPVLDVDDDAPGPGAGPVTAPAAGDPASILFTSGSSGRPKATVLEHRNLVHFATNTALPALRPGDRVAQVSSVSFDAFHFEAWCALAAGAEVVVLPDPAALVERGLRRELRRHRITAMLAPTMLVNTVTHDDPDAFEPLSLLLTGGDVLSPGACRAILGGAFAGELWNLYGPTEATTACTAHRVAAPAPEDVSVPIGRPLDGVEVLLLDPRGQPVPPGTAGEIHVAGRGVAAGHLADPDRTRRAFGTAPGSGRRTYATGDRGVVRPDGALEFLGRLDDQVKIRGYRVEPGEVERALARHPAVRDVAVRVVGPEGGHRLVAAVVPAEGAALAEVRAHAAAVLPDHMVPTVHRLDRIPATAHGKRDLAELDRLVARPAAGEGPAPADEVARYLTETVRDLLSVDEVGGGDLAALGGNSLLASRMQARILRDRGIRLRIQEILEADALDGLAEVMRRRESGREGRRERGRGAGGRDGSVRSGR